MGRGLWCHDDYDILLAAAVVVGEFPLGEGKGWGKEYVQTLGSGTPNERG